MNHNPLVSILIPVYNAETYIKRCAQSVFDQTYKNIEVIFLDDKSPDNSIKILEEFIADYRARKEQTPRYEIIRAQNNCGSSETRNKLISVAKGDYLFFLDSDDCIPPNAIKVLIAEAIKNRADIVRGQFHKINLNGTYSDMITDYPTTKSEYINKLLNWGTLPLSVWGGLYKRSLIIDNNLKFNNGHNFGEDFSMSARLAYFAKCICAIPEFVYNYQLNPLSITHNFCKKSAIDFIANSNLILDFYKSKTDYAKYEKSILIGRAKIKCYILCYLPKEERQEFLNIFPELNNNSFISFWGKLKLFSVRLSPLLYKVINKINSNY